MAEENGQQSEDIGLANTYLGTHVSSAEDEEVRIWALTFLAVKNAENEVTAPFPEEKSPEKRGERGENTSFSAIFRRWGCSRLCLRFTTTSSA